MTYRGYSEPELITNRASLLLFGGSATDRRAWAEEAQQSFAAEGPLLEVTGGSELGAALALNRGVVFIPEVGALSEEDQGKLVRCLQEREERPKLVIGVGQNPQDAVAQGRLRGDLAYRLSQAQVDLSSAALKDAIRARRQRAELAAKAERARAAKTKQAAPARKAGVRKAAARRPAPKTSTRRAPAARAKKKAKPAKKR